MSIRLIMAVITMAVVMGGLCGYSAAFLIISLTR